MKTPNLNNLSISLPSGLKAKVNIPAELDSELTRIGIVAFIGGMGALAKIKSPETRKEFLIRYIATIVDNADTAVRSTQMANSIDAEEQKSIVDNFLKSLHRE